MGSCTACPAGRYEDTPYQYMGSNSQYTSVDSCACCTAGKYNPTTANTTIDACLSCLVGTYGRRDLFIPQLCYFREEQRLASFEWMLTPKNFMWAWDNSRLSVEYQIVKNSRQQIIDVTIEMIERLNGTWVETEEDIELQRKFKKLQELLPPHEREPSRIGAKFLREHQHLLPD